MKEGIVLGLVASCLWQVVVRCLRAHPVLDFCGTCLWGLGCVSLLVFPLRGQNENVILIVDENLSVFWFMSAGPHMLRPEVDSSAADQFGTMLAACMRCGSKAGPSKIRDAGPAHVWHQQACVVVSLRLHARFFWSVFKFDGHTCRG